MNLNDVIDRLIELRKINDSGKLPVYVVAGGDSVVYDKLWWKDVNRAWWMEEGEVTNISSRPAEYETECCGIFVTETIKGEAICPCCDKPSRVTDIYPERIRIEL